MSSSLNLSSLVPIRIDVSSSSNSSTPGSATIQTRIVDTLLIDPTVWPNPIDSSSRVSIETSLAANAKTYAATVLGDAGVTGLMRVKQQPGTSFAGRWVASPSELVHGEVFQKCRDCILPQLRAVYYQYDRKKRERLHKKNEAGKTKRSKEATGDDGPPQKKSKSVEAAKSEAPPEQQGSTVGTIHPLDSAGVADGKGRVKENKTSPSQQTPSSTTSSSGRASKHLLPIRIRLSVHGVCIHDDFHWDADHEVCCPLFFAEAVSQDLRLAPEAVPALTVAIQEQVHGLNSVVVGNEAPDDDGGPKQRQHTTAAWPLPTRLHVHHVAHLVSQHRK